MGRDLCIPDGEVSGCERDQTWHMGPSQGSSVGAWRDLFSVCVEALGRDEGGG